jgi:predicted transcriptional regulator
MAKRPPTIPDSELDVLKVLWERGRGTVRELLETLHESGRQWSYATVATLLDRLEAKGMVESDRSDLAFVYRPLISAQEVQQKRVTNLVEKLYGGQPGLLVMHLLKAHPLDPGQAQEVRQLLDQMSREMQAGSASRTRGRANDSPSTP